jgi:hypothetical protein
MIKAAATPSGVAIVSSSPSPVEYQVEFISKLAPSVARQRGSADSFDSKRLEASTSASKIPHPTGCSAEVLLMLASNGFEQGFQIPVGLAHGVKAPGHLLSPMTGADPESFNPYQGDAVNIADIPPSGMCPVFNWFFACVHASRSNSKTRYSYQNQSLYLRGCSNPFSKIRKYVFL